MKPPPYNSVKTRTTNELIKKLNFMNFTTIYIKVLQRILISLDGTDISERGSLMWEEARVLGENPVIICMIKFSERSRVRYVLLNILIV